MPNAAEIKDDGRFLGLFIGRSGSGKSAAAMSFVEEGPLKVYDLDGRLRGGLTKWIDRKLIDYEYFPPRGPNLQAVSDRLNRSFDMLQTSININACNYKTIVTDSITWAATDLLLEGVELTHTRDGKQVGNRIGSTMMSGPEDYKYQSVNMFNIIAFLKSIPKVNIIVTAHIVNKWGKNPSAETKFEPNIIVGEQLTLTDKLAEQVPSSFDHIVKFEKEDTGKELRFSASFHGELARTAYDEIPYGKMDITGVSFYKKMHEVIAKNKKAV